MDNFVRETNEMASEAYLRESIASSAYLGTGISFGLATLFLVLRMYTRGRFNKRYGLDDWILLASWVLSGALTACICLEVRCGMGRHIEAVSPKDLTEMSKVFFASILVYTSSLSLVKISILMQYIHIFKETRPVRIACYIVLFVVSGRCLVALFATAFGCHPIKFWWDKSIRGGSCIDATALWYCNSGVDIISDISMVLIPLFPILHLRMPWKQKATVGSVFVVGGFGVMTTILRLHSLSIVLSSPDLTWNNTGAATWSSVETNVGCICASLAALRPLVAHIFPKIFSRTGRSSTTGGTVDAYNGAATVTLSTKKRGSIAPVRDRGSDTGTYLTLSQKGSDAGTFSTISKKGSGEGPLTFKVEEQVEEEEDEERHEEDDLYHSYMAGERRGTVTSAALSDRRDSYNAFMKGSGSRRGTAVSATLADWHESDETIL